MLASRRSRETIKMRHTESQMLVVSLIVSFAPLGLLSVDCFDTRARTDCVYVCIVRCSMRMCPLNPPIYTLFYDIERLVLDAFTFQNKLYIEVFIVQLLILTSRENTT